MDTNLKNREFMYHFHTKDIFRDTMVTMITKKYSLDICKFDNWMQTYYGYNIEEHGSLRDFIQLKFGKEAVNFIDSLLTVREH